MAVRFEFDYANKILLVHVEGPLTDQAVAELSKSIRRQLGATGARAGIFDFTGVTQFKISSDFVQRHSRNGASKFQGIPGVVVVPQDVAYGLARMFQIMTEHTLPSFSAVKTIDEAIKTMQTDVLL